MRICWRLIAIASKCWGWRELACGSLLLPEVVNFKVLLASNLVTKDQTGLLARSHPTGNVRSTNVVCLQWVAASAQQLRVRLIAPEVIHDGHQAAIEDLFRPCKRGNPLTGQNRVSDDPVRHYAIPADLSSA